MYIECRGVHGKNCASNRELDVEVFLTSRLLTVDVSRKAKAKKFAPLHLHKVKWGYMNGYYKHAKVMPSHAPSFAVVITSQVYLY
jgi:hypothetical protein